MNPLISSSRLAELVAGWRTRLEEMRERLEEPGDDEQAWRWRLHQRILMYLLARYETQVGGAARQPVVDPSPSSPPPPIVDSPIESCAGVKPRRANQLARRLASLHESNRDRYDTLEPRPAPRPPLPPEVLELKRFITSYIQLYVQEVRGRPIPYPFGMHHVIQPYIDPFLADLVELLRQLQEPEPDLEAVSRMLNELMGIEESETPPG